MRISVWALSAVLVALPLSGGLADETEPLTVGKVTYLIPKNNIKDRERKKLTYADCTAGSNCRRFEITLDSSSSGRDYFDASLKGLEKLSGTKITPQADAADYKIYKFVKPNPNPSAYTPDAIGFEVYANDRLGSYFTCMIVIKSGSGPRVCVDKILLADGNSAALAVQLAQIEELPDIEAGIRKLVESFAVQGGK
jgi:hypothetical protein